jgi:hypothetical protein
LPRQQAQGQEAARLRGKSERGACQSVYFAPTEFHSASGHSNLWAERMKGKFDFTYALVVGAFLPGDLDRSKPGPSRVDEIYTYRG